MLSSFACAVPAIMATRVIPGRKDRIATIMAAPFMTCSATFLLLFRDAVVGVYTNDPSVTEIAISLLLMAAIFQIADGVQIDVVVVEELAVDRREPHSGLNLLTDRCETGCGHEKLVAFYNSRSIDPTNSSPTLTTAFT